MKVLIIIFCFLVFNLSHAQHPIFINKDRVVTLGLALRDVFYPHLPFKEVKLILRHTGEPDNQNFIFAKYRMSMENYADIENIELIANLIAERMPISAIPSHLRPQAEWLESNYDRLVCRGSLD